LTEVSLLLRGKILFVGQAPSQETDGMPPFTGKCGRRLADLMSMSQKEMLTKHDFVNVLDRWPGSSRKGDQFPIKEAIQAANVLRPTLSGRWVILLGSNVAKAFKIKSFRYFNSFELPVDPTPGSPMIPWVCVVPHPSGVNRWFNDPTNKLVAKKFFQELARITT